MSKFIDIGHLRVVFNRQPYENIGLNKFYVSSWKSEGAPRWEFRFFWFEFRWKVHSQ